MRFIFLMTLLALLLSGSAAGAQTPTPTPGSESESVLVGAGDIADCGSKGDEATAALIDQIPGIVFTVGDNAYPSGTADDYKRCYDPSWGRFKERTRPTIGNHDFLTGQGSAYHAYFGMGTGFGKPGASYYSYTLGNWHIVVIDSNLSMTKDSPQVRWLQADLAANPTPCTLAMWHHPLFTSGIHGNDARSYPIWKVLYDQHAEIILGAHDHDYERFAPQTPEGKFDAEGGIREFVVGMGGSILYRRGTIRRNSEIFNNDTFGVLKLTLLPMGYRWEFVPVVGKTFTDAGEGVCRR